MTIIKTALPDVINPNIPTVSASGYAAAQENARLLTQTASAWGDRSIKKVHEQMALKGSMDGTSVVNISPSDGSVSIIPNELPKPGTTYADNYRKAAITAYEAGINNQLSIKASELQTKYPFSSGQAMDEFGTFVQGLTSSGMPEELVGPMQNNAALIGQKLAGEILINTQNRSNSVMEGKLNDQLARLQNDLVEELQVLGPAGPNKDALAQMRADIDKTYGALKSLPQVNHAAITQNQLELDKRVFEAVEIGKAARTASQPGGLEAVMKTAQDLRVTPNEFQTQDERIALAAQISAIGSTYINERNAVYNAQKTEQTRAQAIALREARIQYAGDPIGFAQEIARNPNKYAPSDVSAQSGALIDYYGREADQYIKDGNFEAASGTLQKALADTAGTSLANYNKYYEMADKVWSDARSLKAADARVRAGILAEQGTLPKSVGMKELIDLEFSEEEAEALLKKNGIKFADAHGTASERAQTNYYIDNQIPLPDDLSEKYDNKFHDLTTEEGMNSFLQSAYDQRRIPIKNAEVFRDALKNGGDEVLSTMLNTYNRLVGRFERHPEGELAARRAMKLGLGEGMGPVFDNFTKMAAGAKDGNYSAVLQQVYANKSSNSSYDRSLSTQETDTSNFISNWYNNPGDHYKNYLRTPTVFGYDFEFAFASDDYGKDALPKRTNQKAFGNIGSLKEIPISPEVAQHVETQKQVLRGNKDFLTDEEALLHIMETNEGKFGPQRNPDGSYEIVMYPINYWANKGGYSMWMDKDGVPRRKPLDETARNVKISTEMLVRDAASKAFVDENDQPLPTSEWPKNFDPDTVRFVVEQQSLNNTEGPSYTVFFTDPDNRNSTVEMLTGYRFSWDESVQAKDIQLAQLANAADFELMKQLPNAGIFQPTKWAYQWAANKRFEKHQDKQFEVIEMRQMINHANEKLLRWNMEQIDVTDEELGEIARRTGFLGMRYWNGKGPTGIRADMNRFTRQMRNDK